MYAKPNISLFDGNEALVASYGLCSTSTSTTSTGSRTFEQIANGDIRNMIESGKHVILDKYIVMQQIGKGSFGNVKAALNIESGEKVALKVLNRQKLRDMKVVAKTKREIKLLARLRHPNVIKLLGAHKVIATPTDLFLVVEYASSGDLFDFILKRGTTMPVPEARRLFQQIIHGLVHCHKMGVVHRDLKPENILLDEHNNVKIADFGLSNVLCDGNLLKTSCGSPNYAAPEIILGNHYIGPEVDVWSAGVILYVLLIGKLPFEADKVDLLFRLITRGSFHVPSGLDLNAARLLRGIICVDVSVRYTTEQIIQSKWFEMDLPTVMFPDLHDPVPQYDSDTPSKVPLILPKHLVTVATVLDVSVDTVARGMVHKPQDIGPLVSECRNRMAHKTASVTSFKPPSCPSRSRPPQAGNRLPTSLSRTPKRIVRPCLPIGKPFCSASCDMCPTWGATECLFANRIQNLETCDMCPDQQRKGCMLQDAKLTMEDMCRPQWDQPKYKMGGAYPRLTHGVVFTDRVEHFLMDRQRRFEYTRKLKWHLGIRSASKPMAIMLSLYDVLRKNGFEWQTLAEFNLRVRKAGNKMENSPTISLALYQVRRGNPILLIDFRNMDPPDTPEDENAAESHPQVEGLVRREHNRPATKYFRQSSLTTPALPFLSTKAGSASACELAMYDMEVNGSRSSGRGTWSSDSSTTDTEWSIGVESEDSTTDVGGIHSTEVPCRVQLAEKRSSQNTLASRTSSLHIIDEVGEAVEEMKQLNMDCTDQHNRIDPRLQRLMKNRHLKRSQLDDWMEIDNHVEVPHVSHTLSFLDSCATLITAVMNGSE